MILLELKNIKKYFPIKRKSWGGQGAFVKAVDQVSLSIYPGENVSLVGESGCGKTTLARIMIKLIQQDSGSIKLEGQEVANLKGSKFRKFRKDIQMVFQDPFNSLDPRFTVFHILKEAMTLEKVRYRHFRDQEQRIKELLAAVDLPVNILNRYPHEFSGGERQRIAIARALVLNPKLLILDEAVSSLDVLIQDQILKLLQELQDKFQLTYLFISHNLKVVRRVSHKIAVMYKGKIVEMAATQEIFQNPLHPYTKELLSAAIEYKSVRRSEDINIHPNAQLVEKEKGHFVLDV
ncbi:MAG: ABC transporter ATP-binding protein [Candidatus Omnitrophica bacterium]|nr:ABC transporter ATP-binding protein [Candidatus Omnitrophota bacterium]MCB9748154.1 ABC transporter ATP-binding protein [Candidatus Omnitrophota bacterium]